MQFGFAGRHQVEYVSDGTRLYIGNPLADDGALPLPIAEPLARKAAEASALG
jgi:hypothetical protein